MQGSTARFPRDVFLGGVDVRPPGDEQFGHGLVAGGRGVVKRRQAVPASHIHLGPVVQEVSGHGHLPQFRGFVERGLALLGRGIDQVGAVGDQALDPADGFRLCGGQGLVGAAVGGGGGGGFGFVEGTAQGGEAGFLTGEDVVLFLFQLELEDPELGGGRFYLGVFGRQVGLQFRDSRLGVADLPAEFPDSLAGFGEDAEQSRFNLRGVQFSQGGKPAFEQGRLTGE